MFVIVKLIIVRVTFLFSTRPGGADFWNINIKEKNVAKTTAPSILSLSLSEIAQLEYLIMFNGDAVKNMFNDDYDLLQNCYNII